MEPDSIERAASQLCGAIMDLSNESFWLECPDPMNARAIMIRRVQRFYDYWRELTAP